MCRNRPQTGHEEHAFPLVHPVAGRWARRPETERRRLMDGRGNTDRKRQIPPATSRPFDAEHDRRADPRPSPDRYPSGGLSRARRVGGGRGRRAAATSRGRRGPGDRLRCGVHPDLAGAGGAAGGRPRGRDSARLATAGDSLSRGGSRRPADHDVRRADLRVHLPGGAPGASRAGGQPEPGTGRPDTACGDWLELCDERCAAGRHDAGAHDRRPVSAPVPVFERLAGLDGHAGGAARRQPGAGGRPFSRRRSRLRPLRHRRRSGRPLRCHHRRPRSRRRRRLATG